MKRIITLLVILSAYSAAANAQDIIFTYDSAPIEADIEKIGDDYMYYRTWDNPDGPVYKLSLSRVVRVTFDNGTTKVFAPASPFADPQKVYLPIEYRWGQYYGPYGRMSRTEMMDYIGYTLYGSEYIRARNMFSWGTTLTVLGAAFLVTGISFHAWNRDGMTNSDSTVIISYVLGAAGLGAGIPLWVNGNKRLRKIADDYNRTYINPGRKDNPANLSLGATRHGVGLAFNF